MVRPRHPMPGSVARALESAGLVDAYNARPSYPRNDDLGWIGKAKRDTTEQKRLAQLLDALRAGDVNMKCAWRPSGAESPPTTSFPGEGRWVRLIEDGPPCAWDPFIPGDWQRATACHGQP